MKNEDIIAKAAITAGIITEEEVTKLFNQGRELPIHTLQGWNRRGNYRVKAGEVPLEAKLWKKKDGEQGGFYLAKAKLYTKDQMEAY
ncbi:MAG: hypothetical protein ACLTU1_16795 [Blautia wexlerae]